MSDSLTDLPMEQGRIQVDDNHKYELDVCNCDGATQFESRIIDNPDAIDLFQTINDLNLKVDDILSKFISLPDTLLGEEKIRMALFEQSCLVNEKFTNYFNFFRTKMSTFSRHPEELPNISGHIAEDLSPPIQESKMEQDIVDNDYITSQESRPNDIIPNSEDHHTIEDINDTITPPIATNMTRSVNSTDLYGDTPNNNDFNNELDNINPQEQIIPVHNLANSDIINDNMNGTNDISSSTLHETNSSSPDQDIITETINNIRPIITESANHDNEIITEIIKVGESVTDTLTDNSLENHNNVEENFEICHNMICTQDDNDNVGNGTDNEDTTELVNTNNIQMRSNDQSHCCSINMEDYENIHHIYHDSNVSNKYGPIQPDDLDIIHKCNITHNNNMEACINNQNIAYNLNNNLSQEKTATYYDVFPVNNNKDNDTVNNKDNNNGKDNVNIYISDNNDNSDMYYNPNINPNIYQNPVQSQYSVPHISPNIIPNLFTNLNPNMNYNNSSDPNSNVPFENRNDLNNSYNQFSGEIQPTNNLGGSINNDNLQNASDLKQPQADKMITDGLDNTIIKKNKIKQKTKLAQLKRKIYRDKNNVPEHRSKSTKSSNYLNNKDKEIISCICVGEGLKKRNPIRKNNPQHSPQMSPVRRNPARFPPSNLSLPRQCRKHSETYTKPSKTKPTKYGRECFIDFQSGFGRIY